MYATLTLQVSFVMTEKPTGEKWTTIQPIFQKFALKNILRYVSSYQTNSLCAFGSWINYSKDETWVVMTNLVMHVWGAYDENAYTMDFLSQMKEDPQFIQPIVQSFVLMPPS